MTKPVVLNPSAIGNPDETPIVYFDPEGNQWEYVRGEVADDICHRLGDVDMAALDLTSPYDRRRLTEAILRLIDDAMEDHL